MSTCESAYIVIILNSVDAYRARITGVRQQLRRKRRTDRVIRILVVSQTMLIILGLVVGFFRFRVIGIKSRVGLFMDRACHRIRGLLIGFIQHCFGMLNRGRRLGCIRVGPMVAFRLFGICSRDTNLLLQALWPATWGRDSTGSREPFTGT